MHKTNSGFAECFLVNLFHHTMHCSCFFYCRGTLSQQAKVKAPCIKNDEDQEGGTGWDKSTKLGDGENILESPCLAKAAEEMLDFNPEMKSVHSIASARALLSRSCDNVET